MWTSCAGARATAESGFGPASGRNVSLHFAPHGARAVQLRHTRNRRQAVRKRTDSARRPGARSIDRTRDVSSPGPRLTRTHSVTIRSALHSAAPQPAAVGPHRLRRRRRPVAAWCGASVTGLDAGEHGGLGLTALVIGFALRHRKPHVRVVAPARRRIRDARLVAAMTAAIAASPYVPLPAEGRYRRVLATLRAMARRALRFRLRCLILGHEDAFGREPRPADAPLHSLWPRNGGLGHRPRRPGLSTARVTSPGRRPAALETAVRVGPWTLRRTGGRAEARERQRQRLVAAAARAAEHRSHEGEPRHRAAARRPASAPHTDRWMDVARRVRAGLGG